MAIVAAMTVSCRNNKKTENAATEAAEAAKTVLADDVLATIDGIAQKYVDEAGKINVTGLIASSLTEEENL